MRENAARQRAGPDAAEGGVLAIVQGLVIELGVRSPAAVTPHARLDHDLGIGSLERVELLPRLEQQFGVRLPDAVMAEAGTPAHLIAAIRGAAPARPEPALETRASVGPGVAAPDARTLVEALRWHAESHPDRVHVFLQEEDGSETPITYGALWAGATAVVGLLGAGGLVAYAGVSGGDAPSAALSVATATATPTPTPPCSLGSRLPMRPLPCGRWPSPR